MEQKVLNFFNDKSFAHFQTSQALKEISHHPCSLRRAPTISKPSLKLLREIELDIIGFLDRDSLDDYQLISRDKGEVVRRSWNVLSLRRVKIVYVVKFGISGIIASSFS